MSVHPHGSHAILSAEAMRSLALMTRVVHGFAIGGLALLFLGALALTKYLNAPDRLSVAALVSYGFSAAAIMIAGSMSGFVAPVVIGGLVAGDPLLETRRLFMDYTFRLNQAFASVFVFASCVAILLWSIRMWRARMLSPALGIYGMVAAGAICTAMCSGRLALDVHGFGLVTLLETIWFVIAGVLLARSEASQSRSTAAVQDT